MPVMCKIFISQVKPLKYESQKDILYCQSFLEHRMQTFNPSMSDYDIKSMWRSNKNFMKYQGDKKYEHDLLTKESPHVIKAISKDYMKEGGND